MRRAFVALILSILPTPAYADELVCLANNIYYEARNQSFGGMYAVAEVTLNRVENRRWPNDICNVVQQRIVLNSRWVCQFSWYCDGKSDNPKDFYRYRVCYMIAYMAIHEKDLSFVPPGTYWYHSNAIRPYWVDAYHRVAVIGDHTFYSDKF
tara:strand:- start:5436 stop:5891 length:456 start_codon:yes stop_codon:yes gene_type:complete